MATSAEFIQFVSDQVQPAGDIRYRKMFGEYMLYCDNRPVLLICDDTVYVKQMPDTLNIFVAHGITPDLGTPYDGAKPHYILDPENTDLAVDLVRELARILPLPKSATRKKDNKK